MEELKKTLEALQRYALMSAKNVLTFPEAALYIGISESRLYLLTGRKLIPHYKPNSKRVYFDKDELDKWMKQNRVMTLDEAEEAADAYDLATR